jgi:glucitol/sorbitol PTS system EIIC component
MGLMMMAAHAAEWLGHGATLAAIPGDHASHVLAAGAHLDTALLADAARPIILVQDASQSAPANSADALQQYQNEVKNLKPNADQLGWLGHAGTYFIGMFQKGGEVFVGFVTGIIPTLVVLMTAFYALTGLIGEERVHGFAQSMGKIALTRYTVLPVLSVFFLTNPMAYTFGTFLEEKHKPAFYDSAVSFVHPILGLFPHANAGEYFVWGGVLVALLDLEKRHVIPEGYHVKLAIWYFIVGLIVILLKGIVTERITAFMARRQGVEL